MLCFLFVLCYMSGVSLSPSLPLCRNISPVNSHFVRCELTIKAIYCVHFYIYFLSVCSRNGGNYVEIFSEDAKWLNAPSLLQLLVFFGIYKKSLIRKKEKITWQKLLTYCYIQYIVLFFWCLCHTSIMCGLRNKSFIRVIAKITIAIATTRTVTKRDKEERERGNQSENSAL